MKTKITIFTPTYNRGYIIEQLYRSLQRQSCTMFEWLVIDDGSSDNTEELFRKFQSDDNCFEIRYIRTDNGGKHRAINKGVQLAKGELFFIVDSDDYLTDNSIEKIIQMASTIRINESFAGICGRRGHPNDINLGTTFEGDVLDITMLERKKHGITGDKAEVFYTDILRRYPFPEYEGEKFLTEAVVWYKIAGDGYKLRFFNEVIYLCDYLPDGLTAHESELFLKNPKGYGAYLYTLSKYGLLSGIEKWNRFFYFYNCNRKKMSYAKMAQCLNIPVLLFYFRILGMKIFYKLYDK